MPDQMYLERDEQKYGPYSSAHLMKLAVLGRLRPTDLVWKEGMEKGVLAARVKKLFPEAPTLAPAANARVPTSKVALPLPVRSLSPQTPAPLEDSGPAPVPSNAQGASPELLAYDMPDELALVPVGGHTDWEPEVAPAATDSPSWNSLEGPAAATDRAAPDKPVAVPKQPGPKKEAVRKRRAVAVSGAVLVSQDGVMVRYRKKCFKCGQEDGTTNSMAIGIGVTRVGFFCRTCKKMRDAQIQGIS
jgi:uncharacterized protein DUF4339